MATPSQPEGQGWKGGRTVILIALVVIVVLLVATVAVVTRSNRELPCDADTPDAPQAAQATPALDLPTRPKALVFGDSFTFGWGGTTRTEGYAYKVGSPLGWEVTVDGVGTTGYLNSGRDATGNYRSRLSDAPAGPFDVVVLQGSSNDVKFPVTKLGAAVDDMVTATRARYPGAQLVLLGPIFLYAEPTPGYLAVNDVLASYAAEHDLVYLNPIREKWFGRGDAARFVNRSNGHPNNLGYTRIAERFTSSIRTHLPSTAATC